MCKHPLRSKDTVLVCYECEETDRDAIRREAFEEAAKIADRHQDTDDLDQYARASDAIRALASAPARITKEVGDTTKDCW